MAVSLVKGQGVDLRKEAPNLKKIMIGLGWDPKKKKSFFDSDIDIDASVICIDENGREESVVYYHHLRHRSGAITHYGDNLTGAGKKNSDKEQIEIVLDNIPSNIKRLVLIVNIYEAYCRRQHFGNVNNCFARVVDLDSGRELVRYDVNSSKEEDVEGKTGLFVGDLYRYNGDWRFKAVGQFVRVRNISEMVEMKCK